MATIEDVLNVTAKNYASKFADNLLQPSALNRLFYGDDVPWSKRSLWYKTKWHLGRWRNRIAGAWAVLSGDSYAEGYE